MDVNRRGGVSELIRFADGIIKGATIPLAFHKKRFYIIKEGARGDYDGALSGIMGKGLRPCSGEHGRVCFTLSSHRVRHCL
jgi:hypothetical protein